MGAGVIGCEYATIFSALGIKVFIVNKHDNILGFLDNEISKSLVQQMRSRKIKIMFNTSINDVLVPESDDDPIKVTLASGEVLNIDMFLYAAGRNGNVKDLNCEKAGLTIRKRETFKVNKFYQTEVPHIYAVGDVIGFPALASTGMDQGRIAVEHMFKVGDLGQLMDIFPYGIYTIPEVSMVGKTGEEVEKKNIDYFVGRSYYKDMARGRIMGVKDDAYMKLIFDRTTQVILGVHIIGNMACELIHYGAALVKYKKNINDVLTMVFNYPSLHDLYKYACYDGLGNLSGHKIKD